MSIAHSMSGARADKIIAEQANSQLRTFFDELKNGTRNYQTIKSLDEQIAKEYQGRCILELLQNAHDALANAKGDDPRQIFFVLITTPEPALLVGNSGAPFLKKDFKGICQLAQSPKDPDKSIGNKGLGFRSVLEISTCPEIWSTASPESDLAFAFRFDPAVSRQRMTKAAEKLEEEGLEAHSPFDSGLLVDWKQGVFERYQERLKQLEINVAEEIEKLSPYQFPLLMDNAPQPEVEELLKEGCVTVIRLPLDGGISKIGKEEALRSVKKQLEKLDARSTLFLSNLETLSIDIDGEQRTLKRKVLDDKFLGCQRSRQQKLSIECSNKKLDDGSFHVWTRSFGGKDNPQEKEKIRDKVKDLPDRWPEVHQVTVGVAVKDTPEPDPGVFVIFLPTDRGTGTGAHINAHFYGSLNRSDIKFDESYNKLLLDFVSELCLDVINDLVSGKPEEWRAQAVIDILSSSAGEGVMNELLVERATERGYTLKEQALILCDDDDWRVSNEARLLNIPDGSPISASQWRECAQFPVVSGALDGREDAVKKLIKKLNDNRLPDPTDEEWKRTIEQMAENIQNHNIEITWNDFMESVIAMLPYVFKQHSSSGNSDPLADMKFLPTQHGRLLAASDATKLFFRPVQGDDVEDLVEELPSFLEEHIAFLHQDIQTQDESQYHNKVREVLERRRFVRSFGREEILRVVVKQASEVSKDAIPHAEILAWTLKFLIVGDPVETTLELLKDLPVVCHGGWIKMSEVVFGPGWTNNGDLVWSLAESLADELPEGRAECLLPPDDSHWGAAKEGIKDKEDLFRRAGVFDGLRLKEEEDIKFQMGEFSYELPSRPPSGIPQEDWDDWRKIACMEESPFTRSFEYVLSGIRLLPEIHCLSTLKQSGRKALSNLVLNSVGCWPDGWERVEIEKTSGDRSWSDDPISPLKHWLEVLPWFVDGDNGETTLSQRWLVPAYLLKQNSRFQHLAPLSKELTKSLEEDAKLKNALENLGLNVYPKEEEKTGPKLLEALANAWSDSRVPPELFAVFLEQVRHAWQHFDTEERLPKRFLARTGEQKPGSFEVYERDRLSDVYLPDHKDRARSLLKHNRPVLEMRVSDARRVANELLDETAIKQASTLEEKFVVNGTPWRGEIDKIPLLNETKYKWLPVPLLAIFAHGGTNPAGAETQDWRQAADRLRDARVLECEDITVQLVDEQESIVAQSEPEAQWLKEDKVLVVKRNLGLSYEKLAPAVQAILDRKDLLSDLRCVLLLLDGEESPTQEQIDNAIKKIDIDAGSLVDIRQRWTDDTDFLIERVKPVLLLFEVSTDELDEIEKDNQRLAEWLSGNFPQWLELFSEARRCRDDHEMGKATWRKFGDDAQLPKWNAILEKLGREPIGNNDKGGQTEAHIKEVKPLLRGFARHVAVQAENPDLFLEIEAISQNFQADECWSEQWWEVPFEVVLKALCADYAKLPDVRRYLSAFENVREIEDLRAIFEKQGIGTEPNPYETYGRNKERFDKMFRELYGLYELWREDEGLEATPSGSYQAPEKLDARAYLYDWQDAKLFERSFAIINDDRFREACAGCASLDEVGKRLNLTPKRVEDKRKKLHQREIEKKQKADRELRTHKVAGADFVVGVSDYGELFKHINSLPELWIPHPEPDEFPPLEEIGGGGGGGGGGSYLSPPPELPELVGVVGEMWAFRYLQARFEDAVTRDDWVSKNRLKGLPPAPEERDRTDDSFGYDFSFSHEGEKWHIEVKATKGDETQFELGTTEIEAAIRIAQSSSEQWRVLRVRRALSEEPKFDWLPNPFKEGFGKHFRLSSSGMWVSYRLKNASSDE